jgi:predicted CopG family antitoxin
MITTIQISDEVKNQLKLLKGDNRTFEEVILFLLKERENNKARDLEIIKKESKMLREINKEISVELGDTDERGSEFVEW